MKVYGYDFDGVISIGITPSKSNDVIITGRCVDEKEYVLDILKSRGINNRVCFNPMTLKERGNHTEEARGRSGLHKSNTIRDLKAEGIEVVRFFEDDKIQHNIIRKFHPKLELVYIYSELVEK